MAVIGKWVGADNNAVIDSGYKRKDEAPRLARMEDTGPSHAQTSVQTRAKEAVIPA
jgi:hypothetical protein